MSELEKLVREWRDAQLAIDATPQHERQHNRAPLDRMIAAHNALLAYANENLK
jgi:hypothetical protein